MSSVHKYFISVFALLSLIFLCNWAFAIDSSITEIECLKPSQNYNLLLTIERDYQGSRYAIVERYNKEDHELTTTVYNVETSTLSYKTIGEILEPVALTIKGHLENSIKTKLAFTLDPQSMRSENDGTIHFNANVSRVALPGNWDNMDCTVNYSSIEQIPNLTRKVVK